FPLEVFQMSTAAPKKSLLVWLPEMRLPAPGAVPPIRLWPAPKSTCTPAAPLPSAAVPAALVPLKLPWIRLPPLVCKRMPWPKAWVDDQAPDGAAAGGDRPSGCARHGQAAVQLDPQHRVVADGERVRAGARLAVAVDDYRRRDRGQREGGAHVDRLDAA